jgi:hypothetical protein
MDDSHLLITAGSDPPVMSSKKEHVVSCRIPNDRMTAASQTQPAAIALIQGRLPLK